MSDRGGAVDRIAEKDRIYLPMPMIKEKDRLKAIHDNDAAAVAELLDQEKNVVFLTLEIPRYIPPVCMYINV